MHLCMRTTIDLDDDLALRAKKEALERRSSLKALVEEGLKLVLAQPANHELEPLDVLAGMDRKIWTGVNVERFIRDARRGWK